MPLHVNLALHSTDRVVREVQAALRRGEKEKLVATRAAGQLLQGQLRSELTGILLNSELALRQASISSRCGREGQVGARAGGEDEDPAADCVMSPLGRLHHLGERTPRAERSVGPHSLLRKIDD